MSPKSLLHQQTSTQQMQQEIKLYFSYPVLCTAKTLKFHMGFLRMIWFREIKYHSNILAVYCNNITIQIPRN